MAFTGGKTYPAYYSSEDIPLYSKTFTSIDGGDVDLTAQTGYPKTGCARIRVFNSHASADQALLYYSRGRNISGGGDSAVVHAFTNTTTVTLAAGDSITFDEDIVGFEATGSGADIEATCWWWEGVGIPINK